MTTEPEDGGYASLKRVVDGVERFELWRRSDSRAFACDTGDARWFSLTNRLAWPLAWAELIDLGEIAYVGEFVDRSDLTAHRAEKPWRAS